MFLPVKERFTGMPFTSAVVSKRIYSLLEIMYLFEAGPLQELLADLHQLACDAETLTEQYRGSSDAADEQFTKRALRVVQRATRLAINNLFRDASVISSRAQVELGYPQDYAYIRSEVTHVADAISDEVSKRSFFVVALERREYTGNPKYIGQNVLDAFPSAVDDITEAGNCFAFDCNTAAVFHLMRVVEWGLRALCAHMGLRKAKRRKGKDIPISYVDWETMLNQLQPIVDAKIEKMRRGKAKQEAQEFYYPVLQDIRAIRDAWRNHLMHTRASYSSKDAEAILSHVKRLMSTLSVIGEK
jgi:hypothetical protein